MGLQVLSGLPGSGKSAHLIARVNERLERHLPVATFACADAPRLAADDYVRVQRIIGSRQPGNVCPLDHFTSVEESARLLETFEGGTLVAFEEAHYFGPGIVPHWLAASDRGLDVLVAMPSGPQLRLLDGESYEEIRFEMQCERCQVKTASTFALLADEALTVSVCGSCSETMTDSAKDEILERLERGDPYPGDRVLYQPVELEECAGWKVIRTDSARRVDVMTKTLRDIGVVPGEGRGSGTYLDVGCNTGYFCHALSRLGLYARGVDVTENSIAVARLLTSFVRKDDTKYDVADCYDYLGDTQNEQYDVTSSFSVVQWLIQQRSLEAGVSSMEWLFAKTAKVCFFETGYTDESHLRDMDVTIDRSWVRGVMDSTSGFSEVLVLEPSEHGLMRDLFVGIK